MNWNWTIASICLCLAGCTQTATLATTPAQNDLVKANESEAEMRERWNLKPVKWPLRFTEHSFSATCYDTQECWILYAGLPHGNEKPSPPSSKYGPNYLENWSGGHLGIRNFPGPAIVKWRSKDGVYHDAEIDIAEIFEDGLIRHSVPREDLAELPDGKLQLDPSILLEVNDVTIRVYMRADLSLAQPRIAGNPYSDFRDDLILVKTYHY